MAENTDIDLQSMGIDELENFIKNEGQNSDEIQNREQYGSTEEDITQEADQTQQDEEIQDEVETEPEGQTREDDIPEFYRGKSTKDLINIIEENKRFTSRQGNEIGQLRREISSLKTNIDEKFNEFEPKTKAEKKDFVDELINEYGYKKEDIDVINRLVEHKAETIIKNREAEKERFLNETKQKVSLENQRIWDTVKDLYPNSDELESQMVAEIQKNPNSTLYQEGWVKSFLKQVNIKKQNTKVENTTTSKNVTQQRISKTITPKSASRPGSSNSISRSDLNSSDPEVYRRAWNHFNPNSQI